MGSDIVKVYKERDEEIYELNHDILDITDADLCMETINNIKPDLIVNTAAMHNVELCQEFPEKAFWLMGLVQKILR